MFTELVHKEKMHSIHQYFVYQRAATWPKTSFVWQKSISKVIVSIMII